MWHNLSNFKKVDHLNRNESMIVIIFVIVFCYYQLSAVSKLNRKVRQNSPSVQHLALMILFTLLFARFKFCYNYYYYYYYYYVKKKIMSNV